MFTTLLLLTTIGLAIKCFIWIKLIDPSNSSKEYRLAMFIIYIQLTQSILEYIGYFIPPSYQHLLAGPLITYYICLTITLALIPFLFVYTFKIQLPKVFSLGYISLYIIFISLLIMTDAIVAGAKHNGFTFTRIPGEHYWLFKISVLLSFFFSILLLIFYKKKSKIDFITKIKLSNISLCYSGLAIFCISLVFIMPYYKTVNAVGILPVLMGIFLLGLTHSLTRKNFIDFTYWLPFSKRRRMIKRLVKPLITVCEDGIDIDPKHEYDSIVRQHALELFKGDEAKATHWLQSYQPPLIQ